LIQVGKSLFVKHLKIIFSRYEFKIVWQALKIVSIFRKRRLKMVKNNLKFKKI